MVNFFAENFTNTSKVINTEGDTASAPLEVSYIITVIINSITCTFTVVLNVLVIMAVERRPRLQTNGNILLACLAVTDALTGLILQTSFILWKIFQLLGLASEGVYNFHNTFFYILFIASLLHLMLVTFERLLAIKFTMRYSNVITGKNIKIAVTVVWVISFSFGVFRLFRIQTEVSIRILSFVVISCILFVISSYIILYRETRRHQKVIKTQQLPQEELERFSKENKALKTTVYVFGAVIFCLLPSGAGLGLYIAGLLTNPSSITSWLRTFNMLNSLLNPLIYCCRQKEMRKFVFRLRNQVVHPANQ